jgi:hypothetical protein
MKTKTHELVEEGYEFEGRLVSKSEYVVLVRADHQRSIRQVAESLVRLEGSKFDPQEKEVQRRVLLMLRQALWDGLSLEAFRLKLDDLILSAEAALEYHYSGRSRTT